MSNSLVDALKGRSDNGSRSKIGLVLVNTDGPHTCFRASPNNTEANNTRSVIDNIAAVGNHVVGHALPEGVVGK